MNFERPAIFRPPSERNSYFLPLTSGCSNHSCTFCNFYGSRLKLRKADEIKREIDALALFRSLGVCPPGLSPIEYEILQTWDGKRIFLQDSDAMIYPIRKLLDILTYLNKKLPLIQRIAAYTTPQDILRIDLEDLKKLKALKLGILFLGVETGDEELLKKVHKGVNYVQMVEAGKKIKESGIISSITVILGLAGVSGSHKHSLKTAEILTEIDPDYAGALTLTMVPGTPFCRQWERGEFSPLSPFQSLEELVAIIENSNFTNCFFSSMHASNYLTVRGRLPDEKENMLQALKAILAKKDPSLLRPDFLRGL